MAKTVEKFIVKKVPIFSINDDVESVKRSLVTQAKEFESLNYLYLIDEKENLLGMIHLKNIIQQGENKKLKDLLPGKIITVRPHTHPERAALLALQNNLSEIPVIDKDSKFLGVITSNQILQILDSEAVEDLLKFGGIITSKTSDNIFNLSILQSIKHRFPWLLLGLFGGFLAAGIVKSFENTISKNLILAAFIPLVTYMADAVGTQMEAYMIRDLAINQKFSFLNYAFRQFVIVSGIGLIISLLVYFFSVVIYQETVISFVLSSGLFLAIISSILTGTFVPYLFHKFKFDPANASGPVGTVIQDILSVFIYFLIASLII